MLGGLEGYGSDQSDSESSSNPIQLQAAASSPKKSTFSLPPPTNTNAAKSRSLQPSKSRSKRPVFTVAKPSGAYSDGEGDGKERASKKPRLDSRTAAGSSSLLAMLPAPSKAAPVSTASPQILGAAAQGGGRTGVLMTFNKHTVQDESNGCDTQITDAIEPKSTTLLPPSLTRGKTKPPAPPKESTFAPQVPSVDFFSLGTSPPCVTFTAPTYNATEPVGRSSLSSSITSAPTIPTFEAPPPTPSDPYPGYYQLPSGQWAAYEPEFYRKHYEAWSATHALDGTSQKGFEGAEGDNTVEIDGQEQLDLARKEREEKKALTMNTGGPKATPKMNIKPPKIGSRARTRHQLSALLTEAYDNREALEEKIAQGRRNRKEAGNKYGF